MKTEATAKLALYLPHEFKRDYSFGTQAFQLQIVTVEDGKVRNISDSGEFGRFSDLEFRTQASVDMNEGKPYAYSLEYRGVYGVGLRRAESMVKMLRKIQKADAGFPVRPETFGQYVALHCQALGVKMAVKAMSGGEWHQEIEHRFWKQGEIQYLVDRQIGDFLTANKDSMALSRR